MDKERVGFIGLGIMGGPMAGHLARAGYPLTVFNRTPAKMEPLLALGATAAQTCQELAAQSDIVVSMVSDSPDVEEVYLGATGVLRGARPGSLLIDMSTISPHVAVRIARMAAELGCTMLDAPVSGGDVGARNATLSIMVGGESRGFVRARPLMECLGKPTHCGLSGAGQTVKACNQIATALHLVAMSEALVLAEKAGIEPEVVLKVLGAGYAQSRVMDVRGPKVVSGDFAPGFKAKLHAKDLNIVRETARELGCALPASALAHELFTAAVANGLGELDHSVVIQVLQSLGGILPSTHA